MPWDDHGNKYCETFCQHYRHMSTNTEKFELLCWLRWFQLLQYMRRENVPSVLYLDSDVLLFSKLSDIRDIYAAALLEGGLLVPEQEEDTLIWCASGHISYWTADLLEEFCDFCVDSFCREAYLDRYQKKWNWHLNNKKPGGICDMTTLYLFWKERQKRITNLAKDFKGNVFDLAMCTGADYLEEEYVMQSGKKEVAFVNQHPAFRRNDGSGSSVRAHALHFQGASKLHIPRYYCGEYFKGKTYREAILCLQSLKRRLLNR